MARFAAVPPQGMRRKVDALALLQQAHPTASTATNEHAEMGPREVLLLNGQVSEQRYQLRSEASLSSHRHSQRCPLQNKLATPPAQGSIPAGTLFLGIHLIQPDAIGSGKMAHSFTGTDTRAEETPFLDASQECVKPRQSLSDAIAGKHAGVGSVFKPKSDRGASPDRWRSPAPVTSRSALAPFASSASFC